jgi:hypothetical protein
MARRFLNVLALLLLVSLLAGCDDKHENPFSRCGNGVCDPGEDCDDGAVGTDAESDPCLSSCKFNLCGDGFLNHNASPGAGVVCTDIPPEVVTPEECDPGSLASLQCSDLGFSGDTARCADNCTIDTSTCGDPFTPIPSPTTTRTSTVTPTPTESGPSPTPTPTAPESCGNGTVDEGETCDDGGRCAGGDNDGLRCSTIATANRCVGGDNDGQPCTSDDACPVGFCEAVCTGGTCVPQDDDDCPANCMIEPCNPADTMRLIEITFSAPSDATSATFFVNYPDGTVSIPGSGIGGAISRRILPGRCETTEMEFCGVAGDCPGNARCNRPALTVIPNDLDHALRIVLQGTTPVPQGPAFAILFDDCTGATPPTADDFRCTVQGCADEFGLIEGCTCGVSVP